MKKCIDLAPTFCSWTTLHLLCFSKVFC